LSSCSRFKILATS